MLIAFTGAGISAPSGLPTFADSAVGRKMRDKLTLDFFYSHPAEFYDIYRKLVSMCEEASPNPAHLAIARARIPVITQNIDGLHQRAGSRTVVELHGNLKELCCLNCQSLYPREHFNFTDELPLCPKCSKILKPGIVLYGEPVTNYERACALMRMASYVLVVGTSLEVYPAAYLPEMARRNGAVLEIINEAADKRVPEVIAHLEKTRPEIFPRV